MDRKMSRRVYSALAVIVSILIFYCVYTEVYHGNINALTPGLRKGHWKSKFDGSMRQKTSTGPKITAAAIDGSKFDVNAQKTVPITTDKKPYTIFVIGDSHIYFLSKSIASKAIKGAKLDFDTGLSVHWLGIPGARVETLRNSPQLQQLLQRTKPFLVYIHVGGNDADSTIEENVITGGIRKYANELQSQFNVSKIILSEQFHRTNVRQLRVDAYNMKIIELNKQLQFDKRSLFWKHAALMRAPKDILSHDGVHLNDYGQAMFYTSIKTAIEKTIHAV